MSKKNVIANRYEVIQHIGQGGMADVFRAVDTILNREVAIKILRSDLSTDAVSILRFEREAQAATALAHPNIVEVYDVGDYKGHHYIVMEYVRGQTLKQVIRSRGPLLTEEAVDIMKQLSSAVAEAHSRGIIHRDIKPQNVIVMADGSVKILDFGIATAKGSMQLTQANNVMGSVHYLAPELAKGESASPQSDIYALGIVLFEMLAGDVPFKAEQAVQVALKQMRDPLPDIRVINPMVPQSVANIINRAAAKNPADRYRSAEEMMIDLSTCLRQERLNEPALVFESTGQKPKPAVTEPAKAKPENRTPARRTTTGIRTTEPRGSNKVLNVLLILTLVFIAGTAIFYTLALADVIQIGATTVTVPELRGLTIDQAKDTLQEYDLTLDTTSTAYTLTEDTESGLIISVEPAEDSEVEKGTVLKVTVSSGIGVMVEDYTGMSIAEAEEAIKSAVDSKGEPVYENLTMNIIAEESDEDPGTVIRQEQLEAGTLFKPKSAGQITLVYAEYPTVEIPDDLIGQPINDAVAELEEMGVVVRTSNRDTTQMSQEELDNLDVGVVIDVEPETGSEYTQMEDNYVILYFY